MQRDELSNYLSHGMSQREISRIVGLSQTTVKYYVKKFGFSKRSARYREDGLRRCTVCETDKTISEFYKKDNKTDRRISVCKPCNVEAILRKRRRFKQECVDYKGGSCMVCGYKTSLAALEFHHREPEGKDFSVSETSKRRLIDVIDELDKCDLLCANHHREAHDITIRVAS